MIQISDEVFDNLQWKAVDGKEADSILTGLKVVGAEPVGYPITDGLILYLQDSEGEVIALSTEVNTDTPDEENPLYIDIARVGA